MTRYFIFILSNYTNYSDENFDKFFEALGEGSMEEIAEDDGDDEETSKMSKKYEFYLIVKKIILNYIEQSSFTR